MSTPSFSLLQGDPAGWGNPPAGKTYLGVTLAGQLAIKQPDGSVTVLVTGGQPAFHAQAVAGASANIAPGAPIHTEQLNISGAARTIPITVLTTGAPVTGSLVFIALLLPATPGINLQLFSGANLLAEFDNDGTFRTGTWALYFDGADWVIRQAQFPAYNA